MTDKNAFVRQVAEQKYEYGFTTDVHTEIIEKGLNEDVVRLISAKKGEPQWMLDFRLKAFRHWVTMKEPKWGHVHVPEIDYQAISYYADFFSAFEVSRPYHAKSFLGDLMQPPSKKSFYHQGFFAVKRREVFILGAKWIALVRGWRRDCVVGGMETRFQ